MLLQVLFPYQTKSVVLAMKKKKEKDYENLHSLNK